MKKPIYVFLGLAVWAVTPAFSQDQVQTPAVRSTASMQQEKTPLAQTGAATLTKFDLDFPDLPRHTFAAYSFPAGHAVVVFGGGDAPDPTATCTFFSANAADPGLPFGLHLASPADAIFLLDGDQKVVAYFCYGGTVDCPLAAASDQSLTRSPDVTGDFVPHKSAAGSNGAAFSVGTRVDGSAF